MHNSIGWSAEASTQTFIPYDHNITTSDTSYDPAINVTTYIGVSPQELRGYNSIQDYVFGSPCYYFPPKDSTKIEKDFLTDFLKNVESVRAEIAISAGFGENRVSVLSQKDNIFMLEAFAREHLALIEVNSRKNIFGRKRKLLSDADFENLKMMFADYIFKSVVSSTIYYTTPDLYKKLLEMYGRI